MLKKAIKTIELFLDDSEDSLESISLVENPAVQIKFMAFSEEEETEEVQKFFFQEDLQELVGCAMVPDKKIPRIDEKTKEPYLVFFSKETVRKAASNLLKNGKAGAQNTGHKNNFSDKIYVTESWITETPGDKAYSLYNFSEKTAPLGSWFVRMKVEDPSVWKQVKEGKLNGFSVQGDMILGPETITYGFASQPIKKKYAKLYEGLSETESNDLDVILTAIEVNETGYFETPDLAKKRAKKMGCEDIHAVFNKTLDMTLYAPGKSEKEYKMLKTQMEIAVNTPDYTKEGVTGPISSMGFDAKSDFISSCMSEISGEYPDQDQALAVCYSKWENQ